MMNKSEQIHKLYEDAVVIHLVSRGYPEDRARAEAIKITKNKDKGT